MLVKIIEPGSQKFDVPVSQLIKMSSDGLRGNDLRSLIKRASHAFADAMRRVELKPGEVPVHLIALGATEFYGPNRNGDGFKEATCRRYHGTFVKYARFYRNHVNKDPRKGYGIVKLSHYNEDMHRIELLVALNSTREAAERNGCLVADEELQKLASGDDIAVSMACKVPYDICAGCGNRARTRAEYCTGTDEGGLCKRGGVANRLCFVHEDGFINHVDNPDPVWFDISRVFRPADRIAYTNGILKAADSRPVGGALLAEMMGVTVPPLLLDGNAEVPASLITLSTKLAALEEDIARNGLDRWSLAFVPQIRSPISFPDEVKTAEVLASCARHKICLPLEAYTRLTKGAMAQDYLDAARGFLPGIHGRLLADGSLANFDDEKYLPRVFVDARTKRWAEKHAADYSLDRRHVGRRVLRAALYHGSLPGAAEVRMTKAGGAAESLARDYGMYQLAFLRSLQGNDPDFDLTSAMVIRQNYL